jgi:hypothetical protein
MAEAHEVEIKYETVPSESDSKALPMEHSSKFIKFKFPTDDKPSDENGAVVMFADSAGIPMERAFVLRKLLAMTNPFIVDPDIDAMLTNPEEYQTHLLTFGIDLQKFCNDFPHLDPREFDAHFSVGAMAETRKALAASKQRYEREKSNKSSRYCQACGALTLHDQNNLRKLCACCARDKFYDPAQSLLTISYANPTWELRKYKRGFLGVDTVLCSIFRTPLAFQQITPSRFVVVDQVRDQIYLRDVFSTISYWFANYEIVPVLDVRGVLMVANTCIFFSHAMPSAVRPMVSPYNQMVIHIADLREFTVTAFRESMVLVGGHDSDYFCASLVCHYDWVSKEWAELPKLPVALCLHTAAVFEGCLWVCGGVQTTLACNNAPASTSVWTFDGSVWTAKPDLNLGRIRPRFVVDAERGLLTVVGGRDSDGRQIRSCEAYTGQKWIILPESMVDCFDIL